MKTPKTNVQLVRRDNYVSHFESRKMIQAMPPELQLCYLEAARDTTHPILNDFGADSYTEVEQRLIIRLAQQRGLQASLINRWYVSDEGWNELQIAWQNLCDAHDVAQPNPDMSFTTGRE
jgi:hypothetical protein